MNEKDFDLEFDFEKEYGFDFPEKEADPQIDEPTEEFTLESILAEDFSSDAEPFEGEYTADFDYGPEEELPAESNEEVSFPDDFSFDREPDIEPELSEEDPETDETDYQKEDVPQKPPVLDTIKAVAAGVIAKAGSILGGLKERRGSFSRSRNAEPAPRRDSSEPGRPRKPVSPMRRFKNEQLPLIILCVTAVMILIFIIGSTSRAIANARLEKEAEKIAAESAESAAQQEAKEVEALLAEAKVLAAGYDYQGAQDLLNTFTGSTSKYPAIDQAKADYEMAKSQLVPYTDVSTIANLSFHVLIADPQRAFANAQYGSSYKKNFVTIDEFQSILQELYNNNYILVDMSDVITQTTTDGVTSYAFAELNLPAGKTPIMITETLVNYFSYMVDSDGDGSADKNGAGFASRLVVDADGDIKAEMVDAEGNTVTGNYDLVPILEAFIEAHPDFSYKGARATLAVTGYDGIFGYRTNADVIRTKGQEYYDEQVDGATELVDALREKGYTIACNTYRNKDYAELSADAIQADLNSWNSEVANILGDVNTLVYAQASDISASGNYSGSKYSVLHNEGFQYFISSGSEVSTEVTTEYVRQVRLMVTGTQMANAASSYSAYFDAAAVLDTARGTAQ